MAVEPIDEQIKLYARMLKLPTFVRYSDILRRAQPNTRFDELLLELMKAESAQRQENQNRKRLKAAGFPYTKTLEELELGRYGGELSDLFVNELASCRFIGEMKNIVMVGNPGRGKTHSPSRRMVSTTFTLNSGVYRFFGTPFGIEKHPIRYSVYHTV